MTILIMQETEPVLAPDVVLPIMEWQHPPANLPRPPRGVSQSTLPDLDALSKITGSLDKIAKNAPMFEGDAHCVLLQSQQGA